MSFVIDKSTYFGSQVLGFELRETVSFGTALTWTLVCHFEKSSLQPEIKVHLEILSNFSTVLLFLNCLLKKPVFEYPYAHSMIFFIILG